MFRRIRITTPDGAVHWEGTGGPNQEEHGSLAGRLIVGGNRTMEQGRGCLV